MNNVCFDTSLIKKTKKRGLHSSTLSEVSPNTLQAYSSKSPRRTDVSILTLLLLAS